MRRLAITMTFMLVLAACTGGGSGSSPVVTGTSGGEVVVGDTAPPRTDPPPPTCPETTAISPGERDEPYIEFVGSGDPGLASVTISQATFECAIEAVVVGSADIDRIAAAAVLAASMGAPLLVGSPGSAALVAFELERLAPERAIAVGDDVAVDAPEWTEVERLSGDTASLAAQIADRAGAESSLPLPATPGTSTLTATLNAIRSGAGVAPTVPPPTTTSTTAAASSTSNPTTTTTSSPQVDASLEPEDVPGLVAGDASTGVGILVDGNDTATALAAIVAAETSGSLTALVDERDLRRVPEAGRAIQGAATPLRSIHVLADVDPGARWQLDVLRFAEELPGGGYLVLPRLFVALYGNPLTNALGVLGEQGPEEAVDRARAIAAPYEQGEAPVQPAFEIIATVAAAEVGADGDYSNEMGPEVIQPWVDVAAREDVYVILDLQPGRDSFVNQAKEYEEYLLEPHVGLALDPEWRLGPDQVHLRQIGRVDAAEVNEVMAWLAALVRDNHLPQKVLLLHQFRLFMIENREILESPPELQVIIQMDGQGSIPDKYATWGRITEGWEDHPWSYGWKNFYDEDIPGPIPASEVLDLVPQVVLVSYQ